MRRLQVRDGKVAGNQVVAFSVENEAYKKQKKNITNQDFKKSGLQIWLNRFGYPSQEVLKILIATFVTSIYFIAIP